VPAAPGVDLKLCPVPPRQARGRVAWAQYLSPVYCSIPILYRRLNVSDPLAMVQWRATRAVHRPRHAVPLRLCSNWPLGCRGLQKLSSGTGSKRRTLCGSGLHPQVPLPSSSVLYFRLSLHDLDAIRGAVLPPYLECCPFAFACSSPCTSRPSVLNRVPRSCALSRLARRARGQGHRRHPHRLGSRADPARGAALDRRA